MAAVGSRRPPANMRPQTLPPAAGAAQGSISERRLLLALGLSYAIAAMHVGDESRPLLVAAPSNANVAEFSTLAPNGLSRYSIAEPALSVRPGRYGADGTALPFGMLLLN